MRGIWAAIADSVMITPMADAMINQLATHDPVYDRRYASTWPNKCRKSGNNRRIVIKAKRKSTRKAQSAARKINRK